MADGTFLGRIWSSLEHMIRVVTAFLLSLVGIHPSESWWGTYLQVVKFCIVGASNTLVSLAVYYAFVIVDPDTYLIGNVVGFIVSVLNSYYWNNKYVFAGENRNHVLALAKTYAMYGATTVLSTVLLFVMVELWGISEFLAPLITLVVTIPLNFLLSKFWAFREARAD